MSNWDCICGNTLLIPSGPQGKHLFIVLTDPTNFDGHPPLSCISIPLCTIPSTPYDTTCIAQIGEHPFIIAPSYISYRHIRIDQASHIEKMVNALTAFPQSPVSPNFLARIQSGIHASKQIPNLFKKLMSP